MSAESEAIWRVCEQDGCDILAHVRYWWPGREPMVACLVHAVEVQKVSAAAGFHVPMQPYHGEPVVPEVTH